MVVAGSEVTVFRGYAVCCVSVVPKIVRTLCEVSPGVVGSGDNSGRQ